MSEPQITTGAVVENQYMSRRQPIMALSETEMDALSWFNGLSTTLFSAASFCLSACIGVFASYAFTEKVPAVGYVFVGAGVIALALSISLSVAAIAVGKKRRSFVEVIKSQSVPILPPSRLT